MDWRESDRQATRGRVEVGGKDGRMHGSRGPSFLIQVEWIASCATGDFLGESAKSRPRGDQRAVAGRIFADSSQDSGEDRWRRVRCVALRYVMLALRRVAEQVS